MIGHLTGLQIDGEQDCLVQLQQQLGFERYHEERRLRRALRKNCSAVTKELAKSSRRLEKEIEKGCNEQNGCRSIRPEIFRKTCCTDCSQSQQSARVSVHNQRSTQCFGVGARQRGRKVYWCPEGNKGCDRRVARLGGTVFASEGIPEPQSWLQAARSIEGHRR